MEVRPRMPGQDSPEKKMKVTVREQAPSEITVGQPGFGEKRGNGEGAILPIFMLSDNIDPETEQLMEHDRGELRFENGKWELSEMFDGIEEFYETAIAQAQIQFPKG